MYSKTQRCKIILCIIDFVQSFNEQCPFYWGVINITAPNDCANNPKDVSVQDTKLTHDSCTIMIRYLFVVS